MLYREIIALCSSHTYQNTLWIQRNTFMTLDLVVRIVTTRLYRAKCDLMVRIVTTRL